jgi:hypothetical protein
MAESTRKHRPAYAAPARAASMRDGRIGPPGRAARLGSLANLLNGRPAVRQLALGPVPASGAVIQMVTDDEVATSLRNVQAYSPDMYKEYGEDEIRATLIDKDITVRGHASSSSGSNQNAQTTQDLAVLSKHLKARKAAPSSSNDNNNNNNNNNQSSSSSSSSSSGLKHSKSEEETLRTKKDEKAAAKKQQKRDHYRLTSQGKPPPKKDEKKK